MAYDPSEPRNNKGEWSRIKAAISQHNKSKKHALKAAADAAGLALTVHSIASTPIGKALVARSGISLLLQPHNTVKAAGTILNRSKNVIRSVFK